MLEGINVSLIFHFFGWTCLSRNKNLRKLVWRRLKTGGSKNNCSGSCLW